MKKNNRATGTEERPAKLLSGKSAARFSCFRSGVLGAGLPSLGTKMYLLLCMKRIQVALMERWTAHCVYSFLLFQCLLGAVGLFLSSQSRLQRAVPGPPMSPLKTPAGTQFPPTLQGLSFFLLLSFCLCFLLLLADTAPYFVGRETCSRRKAGGILAQMEGKMTCRISNFHSPHFIDLLNFIFLLLL